MISQVFIDRPRLAIVISVVTVLLGGLCLLKAPIAEYPEIAPPSLVVFANYTGASAEEVADTVATVIEEQMNGLEDLLYFSSTSSDAGLYILSSVFGILITCALECLVALLFKLKGYIGTVAWTNVASQILMRLAYAALYLFTSWSYMTMTLVLEGLIFLGEFLWYLWKMDEVSWPASLAFTITANSVSWLLGHLINLIVFFGVFIMI